MSTHKQKNLNAADFDPRIDDVFARIAHRYDTLCDVFSMGVHRLWKNHIAKRITSTPGKMLLDVASGTGDIPFRVLSRRQTTEIPSEKHILVTDFAPQMLTMARKKLGDTNPMLTYMCLDAHNLAEIESNSIDIYSISFGMKIMDRKRVLAEALRVLKPGGVFYCLEAAKIPSAFIHACYLKYMDWCLPLIARIATAGDSSAYNYLLRGVHEFPEQRAFSQELEQCGFSAVQFTNLTGGIVALHEGKKL